MNYPPIILASKSPRRKVLLKQIDLDFKVVPSNIKEDFSLELPPLEFAEHYAFRKAESIAKRYPDHLVIGADTIVVLDGVILGKPGTDKESFDMLTHLSGRTHRVITAVALVWHTKNITETFTETTRVTFRNLSDEDKNYYIGHYQPFDKAGSYGIQDWFSVGVKEIKGCFYNVMGFPLSAFYQRLKKISGNTS